MKLHSRRRLRLGRCRLQCRLNRELLLAGVRAQRYDDVGIWRTIMATGSIKPSKTPPETIEERFHRLADVWEQATGHLSSMKAASEHEAYQEIIGMGTTV